MRSLQHFLVGIAMLLVLLICTAAALLVYQVDRFARTQSEQQLLSTTRALSLVVDGELGRFEAILRGLAPSGATRIDWAAFDRAARQAVPGPHAWVMAADRSGRQLVNTRLPPGSALPAGPLPSKVWAELDQGRRRVCGLSQGIVERRILCVDVPVMRGGRADYLLSVVMRPERLGLVMARTRLQPGSFATVVDQNGIVIWRNTAAERFIGRPATLDIRRALARAGEGVRESYSLEGVPTVAAYSRSPQSGWTFIVAVPRENMRAGTTRALAVAGIGATVLLVIAGLIGFFAARRITRAVKRLAPTARQIEHGELPVYQRSGLDEVDAAGEALVAALQARRASEERYRRIFEQTSDLILTADLDQVITDCNPSAAAAVGLPRERAVGRRISEFVSPEDFEQTTRMLHQKLSSGGTTRYDVRVRSSTGEWLFWEINSGLTFDREERPVELHVVGRDITERKRAEERQRLLVNELNHRVKNTLAVVQSIANQTLREGRADPAARAALEGRLAALSAAHDVLTRESWGPASLREIVDNAVAPFCTDRRCGLEGPDLRLSPRTAVSMALAVHELATNAAKYGALSAEGGRIQVRWSGEGGRFEFEWREEGGPPVAPPTRRGFGSRMIERALASELGGVSRMEFPGSGLVFTLSAPLPEPE